MGSHIRSLGPAFISSTECTTDVVSLHSVQYHMFADDTQPYSHCAISEIPALVHQLSSCVDDLAKSYASLRLQLNPVKTEFIWFGSRVNLTRIPQRFRSIQVWVCNRVWRCRPGPRCLPGQRAVHEAPRQQHCQWLLLPHPESALDSPLCQQRSPEKAGDITPLIRPLGLL